MNKAYLLIKEIILQELEYGNFAPIFNFQGQERKIYNALNDPEEFEEEEIEEQMWGSIQQTHLEKRPRAADSKAGMFNKNNITPEERVELLKRKYFEKFGPKGRPFSGIKGYRSVGSSGLNEAGGKGFEFVDIKGLLKNPVLFKGLLKNIEFWDYLDKLDQPEYEEFFNNPEFWKRFIELSDQEFNKLVDEEKVLIVLEKVIGQFHNRLKEKIPEYRKALEKLEPEKETKLADEDFMNREFWRELEEPVKTKPAEPEKEIEPPEEPEKEIEPPEEPEPEGKEYTEQDLKDSYQKMLEDEAVELVDALKKNKNEYEQFWIGLQEYKKEYKLSGDSSTYNDIVKFLENDDLQKDVLESLKSLNSSKTIKNFLRDNDNELDDIKQSKPDFEDLDIGNAKTLSKFLTLLHKDKMFSKNARAYLISAGQELNLDISTTSRLLQDFLNSIKK